MDRTLSGERPQRPDRRAWWRDLWGVRTPAGTGGEPEGTDGEQRRPRLKAFCAIAGLMTLVDSINVLSALHDAARRGQGLAVWEPITWEATSGLAVLMVCPIIFAALRMAPPGRRPWIPALLIHAGASLAFSALHIGLMMALRIAVYSVLGFHYRVEAGAGPYEYRKDLLAYLVLAGVIELFTARRPPSRATPQPASRVESAAATFDIIEGARTLRVRRTEIIAVSSAGNYVEFHLEDGRRSLMRATLRELEGLLGPFGFERTHRSWLVNGARVRALEPAGSGDYSLGLDGGVRAPLSRRFPTALARLRRTGLSDG